MRRYLTLLFVASLIAASTGYAFRADNKAWLVAEWTCAAEPDSLPPIDSTTVQGIYNSFINTHNFAGQVCVDSFNVGVGTANVPRTLRVKVWTKRGIFYSTTLDSSIVYTNVQVAPLKPGPFTKLKVQ